jgi:hydrogenase nickel incorporation protein HypA/HybF
MHELAITQEIVGILRERAGDRRVRRVVLEIGKLSAVLPDAVRFCFDLCVEGTPAEGALLEIVETPGRARCRPCGSEVVLERPFGRCRCGSSDLEWISGEELMVRELEVA